ncbi:MAG: lipopolysaccharide heptosyltransferase II [Candidatus Zixiibacteriota bacterium]|nr:MAG: lipopolysaccharide heptosyltransferase II [candidate division Zixibacteria bacterium]
MKKIIVIQTAFPGDVILATPVFEALKDMAPGCFLAAVIRPESYPLLKDNPHIDDILIYNKYGNERGLKGIIRISRLIRDYDWAVIIQRYLRSALIAYLAGIKRRTGFGSSGFRFLYTEKKPYHENRHEVLRCLDLTGVAEAGKYRPRIFIMDKARKKTDKLLSDSGIRNSFAVVAPGSVWATKRYPHFAELIDLVKEEFGLEVILLGGADDIEVSKSVVNNSRHKPFDLTGKTDLLVSAGIISRSRITFTNDSAPAHMAAAVETPVVAIFGPTIPEFGFSPYSEKTRVVDNGKLYCRPCSRHGSKKCPQRHFRCMMDLLPEKVIKAARPLIA